MKLNHVILIVVIALAVYVGVSLNVENTIAIKNNSNDNQISNNSPIDRDINQTKSAKEGQQTEFVNFYQSIYKFIHSLEEIDHKTKTLAEQNPSRTQQYQYFSNVINVMEEGQRFPLTRLIPQGFSKSQTEIMNNTTRELNNAFQYRKFGYEYYLEYLETGSPETYNTSKEWMSSGNSSLKSVIINLEALRVELGYDDIEFK